MKIDYFSSTSNSSKKFSWKIEKLKVMKNNILKFFYEIKWFFLPLSDFKDKIRTLENYNYYFMDFISNL